MFPERACLDSSAVRRFLCDLACRRYGFAVWTATWSSLLRPRNGPMGIQLQFSSLSCYDFSSWLVSQHSLWFCGTYFGPPTAQFHLLQQVDRKWQTVLPLPVTDVAWSMEAIGDCLYFVTKPDDAWGHVAMPVGEPLPPSTLVKYDCTQGSWSTLSSAILSTTFLTSVSANKSIYTFGGYDPLSRVPSVVSSCERFDVFSNSGHVLPPMKTSRAGAAVAFHAPSGIIYVVGGEGGRPGRPGRPGDPGVPELKSIERFDVHMQLWLSKRNPRGFIEELPVRLSDAAAVILGDDLFVIGGFNGERASNRVWRCCVVDPTSSWQHAVSLPVGLRYVAATVAPP